MNLPRIICKAYSYLKSKNYHFEKKLLRSFLFFNKKENIGVILDYDICDNSNPFQYVQYTKEQNLLMFKTKKLFRFLVASEDDLIDFESTFNRILKNDFFEDNLKFSGSNRTLSEVDPSIPEAYFEQAFIDVYGNESLECVLREEPFLDINSQTRYIDYIVGTSISNIAIEKNGEKYHHPLLIGKNQYKKQLIKQNSIIASNMKLYRWSLEGMRAPENFREELGKFIGKKENLKRMQKLNVSRKIKLWNHQNVSLDLIKKERLKGEKNFLVVLPTGTGKTEIYINDLISEIKLKNIKRILILVPQTNLREQAKERLRNTFNYSGIHLKIGSSLKDDVIVVTYSFISRKYLIIDKKYFDYIVVDEAHHAVAPTLIRVIQHFNPKTLIGLTATDKRLDEKRLEEVFGKYEESLTLKEAIEMGILAPIKVFRVESNIDLSQVRFNGKDYIGTDLQRTLIVPSRDQLIVDVLKKYFSPEKLYFKSGIIFCVSIAHAEKMSKLMKIANFSCEAVSSANKNSQYYIENYQKGKIQFLTTCSLLNEGWDSPRTSVIVMARPTLSKVLYTQQLGRGTRKMEGKEALYVIDVVDNYGAYGSVKNNPWSIHALLGINEYKPFANILNPNSEISREELILDSIYESERKLKPIDIFTFEESYGDYYSDEKLARELFVSTGTVKSWVKKGKIIPTIVLEVGKAKINYYEPRYKDEIIEILNLKKHDDTTIYEDFFDFLEERNYSLSYKMVMMLSFLNIMDVNGETSLDTLVKEYTFFYKHRLTKQLKVDRNTCPFTLEYLLDSKKIKQNILQNPFEKFERKRFIHYAKDLNFIMFSSILWKELEKNDIIKIKNQLFNDLIDYYKNLDSPIDEEFWKEYWHING